MPARMTRAATLVLAAGSTAAFGCYSGDLPPGADPPETPEGLYGVAPPAWQGVPSFVLLEPEDVPAGALEPDEQTIDQFGLVFSPTAIQLRRGGTVLFTNSESAMVHNVEIRSLAADSVIFSDDTASGEAVEVVFEETGGYDVTCDHHPGMRAFIYVTTARYGGPAEADGSFAFDVPPGRYAASVWSLEPTLRSEHVVTMAGEATELSIPAG